MLFSVCHHATFRAELTTLGGGGPGVRGRMEKEEAGEGNIEGHSGTQLNLVV